MAESQPDTERPPPLELIAEGMEAIADAIDHVAEQDERHHIEMIAAVGGVKEEAEAGFDRHTEVMSALATINQTLGTLASGLGDVHRLLSLRDQDDEAHRAKTEKRLADLEKGRSNGAAHQ